VGLGSLTIADCRNLKILISLVSFLVVCHLALLYSGSGHLRCVLPAVHSVLLFLHTLSGIRTVKSVPEGDRRGFKIAIFGLLSVGVMYLGANGIQMIWVDRTHYVHTHC
jgi:hypothetical protein